MSDVRYASGMHLDVRGLSAGAGSARTQVDTLAWLGGAVQCTCEKKNRLLQLLGWYGQTLSWAMLRWPLDPADWHVCAASFNGEGFQVWQLGGGLAFTMDK